MCNILVSACLLGMNCRYNGEIKENKDVVELLHRKGVHLVPVVARTVIIATLGWPDEEGLLRLEKHR